MAPAAITITIPGATAFGSKGWAWEGWGTSLAWFAHVIGSNATLTERVCSLLFGESGLWLNIARYNIGGTLTERDPGDFRPGGAVPCVEPAPEADPEDEPTINLALDRAQLNVLASACDHGADTIQAFCNSPPSYMCLSGSSKGATRRFRSNLDPAKAGAFARFIERVVLHTEAFLGVRFHSVSPFNEPSGPGWIEPTSGQEGCFFSWRAARNALRALAARPGLAGRLCIHEEFCACDSLARALAATPRAAWRHTKLLGTHTYDSTNFSGNAAARALALLQDNALVRWALRRARAFRPVWVTEYAQADGHHTDLAAHIVRDIVTLRASAWVYWQAVEDAGSPWGLCRLPFGRAWDAEAPIELGPQFQAMRVLTSHVRPGARVLGVGPAALGAWRALTLRWCLRTRRGRPACAAWCPRPCSKAARRART